MILPPAYLSDRSVCSESYSHIYFLNLFSLHVTSSKLPKDTSLPPQSPPGDRAFLLPFVTILFYLSCSSSLVYCMFII